MRLSFVAAVHQNAPLEKYNLAKMLSFLSSLGYDGVELAVSNPRTIHMRALEGALKKYGLEVPAIGTGLAFMEEKLSLSSPVKDTKRLAVSRIMGHIDFAKRFNAQVIIGLIRGKIRINQKKNGPWHKSYNILLESIKKLCEYAAKKGVRLALEPISRYETSFLNNVDETLEFIEKIGCKNLYILLDSYHMNIEEKNIVSPLLKTGKRLSHFHLADNNRLCPGNGNIDFKSIIATLKEIGYTKYLSGEISALPDFETSSEEYLRKIKRYL